ncbi:MAG TPA: penicillin-binding protein activator, partial [Burkholderiales bacterium]
GPLFARSRMQRFLTFLLSFAGVLAFAVPALSTEPPEAATERPPATESAAPEKEAKPAGEPAKPADPHVALLLPLKSASLAPAAQAVRAGFEAAARISGRGAPPVRVYETGEEPLESVEAYRKAVEAGARVVAGPLTRAGVAALAASAPLKVPVLALNVPEGSAPLPARLYVLSLQAEAEAFQLARIAAGGDRPRAVVIYADTSLDRRIRGALGDAWRAQGGEIVGEHSFSGDVKELPALKQALLQSAPQAAFLAMDAEKARLARAFIDNSISVYATSEVNAGRTDPLAYFDLNGVHFVDMPWLLQPDHPAVMVYPRNDSDAGPDHQRLYALGIDAQRLAQILAQGPPGELSLDGVTGRLTLGADRYFSRELTLARFRQGEIVVVQANFR